MNLVEKNIDKVLPIIFPNIYRVSKEHWNQAIVTLVLNLLKQFKNMNQTLFNDLSNKYKDYVQTLEKRQMEHDEIWRRLENLHLKHADNLQKKAHETNKRN